MRVRPREIRGHVCCHVPGLNLKQTDSNTRLNGTKIKQLKPIHFSQCTTAPELYSDMHFSKYPKDQEVQHIYVPMLRTGEILQRNCVGVPNEASSV